MSKEQKIAAIVQRVCNREGITKRCPQRIAEALIKVGYGSAEQVCKEFAEILDNKIVDNAEAFSIEAYDLIRQLVKDTLKELYGNEQRTGN